MAGIAHRRSAGKLMTIGLVQTAWLFTRGSQSVRIVRITRPNGAQQLLVSGPGAESSVHEAEDPIFCVRYQADLERRLVVRRLPARQLRVGRAPLGRRTAAAPPAAPTAGVNSSA